MNKYVEALIALLMVALVVFMYTAPFWALVLIVWVTTKGVC